MSDLAERSLSRRQQLHPVIREMQQEGSLLREIAEVLGLSVSVVQEYAADPDGSKARERKLKRARPCLDCGVMVNLDGNVRDPAKRCAPCAHRHAIVWTPEAVIEAIQEWAAAHDGQPPTATGWHLGAPGRPVTAIVVRRFGSWDAAIVAAGLVPRGSGKWQVNHRIAPEVKALAAERYRRGESSLTIGRDLGFGYQSVLRFARQHGVQIRPASRSAPGPGELR
jgi:hypothetical protein